MNRQDYLTAIAGCTTIAALGVAIMDSPDFEGHTILAERLEEGKIEEGEAFEAFKKEIVDRVQAKGFEFAADPFAEASEMARRVQAVIDHPDIDNDVLAAALSPGG